MFAHYWSSVYLFPIFSLIKKGLSNLLNKWQSPYLFYFFTAILMVSLHFSSSFLGNPSPLMKSTSLTPKQKLRSVNSLEIAQHLSKAIQFKTISQPEFADQFEQFLLFLEKTYPLTHSTLQIEKIHSFSTLCTWNGNKPQLKPFLLAAHLDVVSFI